MPEQSSNGRMSCVHFLTVFFVSTLQIEHSKLNIKTATAKFENK